jgi:tetrahydromethanopterin S-methyltransferase subunit D
MCPSCLSNGIESGYIAAYAICGLFFLIAALAMFWASRSGRLEGLEDSKFKIFEEQE